jgi:predicted ATPase
MPAYEDRDDEMFPMLGAGESLAPLPRIKCIHITNFLSYRQATLDLADFVALVGANASGKSNAVAAIKLLREIPVHGLPTAIARRGGYDQLRHRSQGHPYDPAIRIDFEYGPGAPLSFYELKFGALAGKRYEVKSERAEVYFQPGYISRFLHAAGRVHVDEQLGHDDPVREMVYRLPPGQSALTAAGSFAAFETARLLSRVQTVEINTARVSELQDPSSTDVFEPDGSNTASILEALPGPAREELIDELQAIVPGMDRVEVRRFADKVTLSFYQSVGTKTRREFLAKQMSDGTLRAFGIVLALLQPRRPALLVIEEPEIAIHLAALRTLVDLLQQQSAETQILITTHSADIVDTLDVDALRVVWNERGASHIAHLAEHTREPVRRGLITPGELLRANALDPVP